MGYYNNMNLELFALVDTTAPLSVEIGCGTGVLASSLLRRAPISDVIGIELNDAAAAKASRLLPHVIVGNIEEQHTIQALDTILAGRRIDQLIIGDVLEHLQDPWSVLENLSERMSSESSCVACVPNASHWSLIARQLLGQWEYTDQGLLDRTHLRFFTRSSTVSMFARFGFHVEIIQPRYSKRDTEAATNEVLLTLQEAATKIGVPKERADTEYRPLQWLFRFRRARPKPIRRIRAISIRGAVPSLASVRLAQPLTSLGGYRPVDWRLSRGSFILPDLSEQPGIIYTYRLHPPLQSPTWGKLDDLAARGWLILHDVDDHPAYLRAQKANDFLSIRSAHAVTVSTPNLADVVRPLNPHVFVVPNQILETPILPAFSHKNSSQPLRLLFAALNRKDDWTAQCASLESNIRLGGLNCELTVVDFPEFKADMARGVRVLPLLDYKDYLGELARTDVVLCPLLPTEFNLCKSDLKTIESLAHGAIPILSSQAALVTDVPRDCILVADHPDDWVERVRLLSQDPEMVDAMKKRGLDWVCRHRMWHAHVHKLDQLHDHLITELAALEASRRARLRDYTPSHSRRL